MSSPSPPAPKPAPARAGKTPPSLPSRSPFGHLRFFTGDPLKFFCDVRDTADVVHARLFVKQGYFVSSPEAVKRMLVDNAANYQKRTRGYQKLKILLGEGLVTSEGDFWLRQRRIAQPAFTRKRLEAFAPQMVTATEELTAAWRDAEGPIDVAEAMNHLALRIAGESLLGADVSGAVEEVGQAMLQVLERFGPMVSTPVPYPEYWPFPSNFRLWRAISTLHRVIDAVIAARRSERQTGTDLLGLLMAARDPETGEAMTNRQLRDEALTMMLAGHETTANALAWTLLLLGQHPEAQDRVAAEIDSVLEERAATADDVRNLVYTRQVLYESMRLYPPVWLIARVPVEPDVLAGYAIPANSFVFISQYAIQRHPALWPNPDRFDPGRFAPDKPPPSRFAWFPFSRGRRQCIGDRFAEMEALLILATLVRRFRFSPVDGHEVIPEPSITLRPRGGLPMHVTPR